MHFHKAAFLLCVVAAAAVGVPGPLKHVRHEKRDAPLKHWVKREAMAKLDVLPMRIGLRQPLVDSGEAALLLEEISHPESPRYGQWYTAEEVAELFAPAAEVVDEVRQWLHSADISPERISQSANKQWLQFDAKVHEAEKLLKTKYHKYEHLPTGKVRVACEEYHVPEHLTGHVDYITPGLRLIAGGNIRSQKERDIKEKRGFRSGKGGGWGGPPVKQKWSPDISYPPGFNPKAPLVTCDQFIVPECIMQMYNISRGNKRARNNQLGIFEEGDYLFPSDLTEFFALFAPYIPPTTQPIQHGIDGGFAPFGIPGAESDLDFQISYPLIWPQNSILFQTDDVNYATGIEPYGVNGSEGFLNTFLDAVDGSYCNPYSPYDPKYPDPFDDPPLSYKGKTQCGVYRPTNVVSISYGEQEDDLPTSYQVRQCNEFLKLGMQGTTVVIASGDSGVAARGEDDGNADGCLGHGEVFNPDFPASCPYLTSAGSTYLPPGGDPKKDQEVATTRFPSGGGFSNIYARPSYQNAAVNNYLTNHNPGYKSYNTSNMNNPPETVTQGGIYNAAGRGYPDVGAVGDNIIIINAGAPMLIGGTSASAPVFAAIINRINEERLARGKRSVGFVNPVLYSNPSAFHDITQGNNSGCGTPGFYAASGWDPVTGLGTPNYPALLKVFMALP